MAGAAPGGYGGQQGYSSSYSAAGSYTSSIWGSQAAQAPILPARPFPRPPGPGSTRPPGPGSSYFPRPGPNRYGGAAGQPHPPGTEPGRLPQPSGPARQARPSFKLRRSIQARPTLSVLNELSGGAKPEWEYLDVPLVERERRAWQADMPVEEVGMFECKCTVGELEFIAEGHTKPEARTAVADLAVQGLITQRCELNDSEGLGSSEDNCPWAAIASLALHRLYTDWQAQGFSLPPELTNTPCDGALSGAGGAGRPALAGPGLGEDKNPLQQLNEMASRMKIALDFELTGEVGAPNDKVFTMAVSLAGRTFAGQGKNKKTARHAAASLALASQEEWYSPPAPEEEEEWQEEQQEEQQEEEPAAKKPSLAGEGGGLPGSYPSA